MSFVTTHLTLRARELADGMGMRAEQSQVAEYIWSVAILLEVYAKSAGLDHCAKLLAEVASEAAKFTDESGNTH